MSDIVYATLFGIGIMVLIGGVAFSLLLWSAQGDLSLKMQISLYVLGVVLIIVNAPAAMLVCRRLFWGDWWPFFGPLAPRSLDALARHHMTSSRR